MSNEDFRESAWPCPAVFADEFRSRCELGRRRLAELRVVLCGLVRDAEAFLPRTIRTIERIGSACADHRVVLYENDSCDGTLARLRAWEADNRRVTVLSETLGNPRWSWLRSLERIRDMAYYRNQYRDFVASHFPDFDHVIVLDTDLAGWSLDGLANTFGHDDWDVMAANGLSHWHGRLVFWDGWSFRTEAHPEAYPSLSLGAMVYPRGAPLVPVASCFGGLAVYRLAALCQARYGATDQEHVVLHQHMRQAGFRRMFLNPSMIVVYPDFATARPGCPTPPWAEERL